MSSLKLEQSKVNYIEWLRLKCLMHFLYCSFIEFGQMIGSDDVNVPSQLSCHMSDGSCFVNASDSCYNSDLGSGNEDSHDTSFIIYEESSDEADFLSV